MRYYTPDSGEVLVNGRPITDYTLHSLREAIGFVSQDPFLFYGSVKDNVIYNQEATDASLEEALRMAGHGSSFRNSNTELRPSSAIRAPC